MLKTIVSISNCFIIGVILFVIGQLQFEKLGREELLEGMIFIYLLAIISGGIISFVRYRNEFIKNWMYWTVMVFCIQIIICTILDISITKFGI